MTDQLFITFTKGDRRDVVPHDNDPIVISLVTAGRTVHRVLVDQGSSADVMFWPTFEKLQLSPDQLRPYGGCLYGFVSDQVEVRGYIELRTTFTDGLASRTEKVRYLVVNAPSAYNILLGRPTDKNQIKEAFINGGRGHPPSHLKFFLLVFSKLKEDIK